jgi:hypothetical protein
MAKEKLFPALVGYALGLAGLFVTVYVAGKAWEKSQK